MFYWNFKFFYQCVIWELKLVFCLSLEKWNFMYTQENILFASFIQVGELCIFSFICFIDNLYQHINFSPFIITV